MLRLGKNSPSLAASLAADMPSRSLLPGRVWVRPAIVWKLAWRNLVDDRVRFIATLVGVAFSVLLMAVQWGLLIGSAQTASALVDHAGADFWIMSHGTSNVDQALPLPERWRFRALAVPGVASVDPLITRFDEWKRPDGRSEIVIVVGFEPGGSGGPWDLKEGSAADIRIPDSIIIDRLYAEKLGISSIGRSVEIGGRRAQVVGFTAGIRAFTQSPYVFTSLKDARRYSHFGEGQTTYLLVRAAPGVSLPDLKLQLKAALPVTDIWSAAEFSTMTARYWLLTTGAGLALIIGAVLGMVIGIAIVAQTLYAATVERLSEYATLAAIGAPNSYLNRIVLRQALISGIFGCFFGLGISVLVVRAASSSTASMVLSWQLAGAVAIVALAMCGIASWLAIHKLKHIDPTMVFR